MKGVCAHVTTVPPVEQELLTLPEHLISPPIFSGIRVTRSLVLCVCFADRCLSFCAFSFGHCVVCSSSIYGFWLPLWYLQTLLVIMAGHEKSMCTCYTDMYVLYIFIDVYHKHFLFLLQKMHQTDHRRAAVFIP
jgi:hypothetical protein